MARAPGTGRETAVLDIETGTIAFGTSGLRGPAADFDWARVGAFVGGFLEYVACAAAERCVYVGADLRDSSPRIAGLVLDAAEAAGWRPVFAGVVPTPALAAHALARQCPAVMVTGSHNPAEQNGIKFYTPDGELLKRDEAPLRAAAARWRGTPDAHSSDAVAAPRDAAIATGYCARYSGAFPPTALAGLSLGVDMHSAAGRDLTVAVLESCGAHCVPFRRAGAFVAVDTEALPDADLARARAMIAAHGLDAVVSTDGDGDRPLLIAETGAQIGGDVLGALTARALGITHVVTPLSATTAIEKSGWFERVVRTRIGSPWVVAGMTALREAGAARVAGFEANGGFLLETDLDLASGHLPRLPTRDALLPLIAVLAAARAGERPVSSLVADLPPRVMRADRVANVAPRIGHSFLKALADSPERRRRLDARLAEPDAIDLTDGVRLSLADGAIVHFRQSGNAGELRCYAETDDATATERLLADMMERLEVVLGEERTR